MHAPASDKVRGGCIIDLPAETYNVTVGRFVALSADVVMRQITVISVVLGDIGGVVVLSATQRL